MTNRQLEIAIYVSAILLAVGVFLPLTKLPVYGEVSYHRIASTESYLVVLFALTAPALLLLNKSRFLVGSVVGVWLVLLFPAIKSLFKSRDTGFVAQMGEKASSVMTEFAGNMFLNIAEFHWGGLVFLIGLIVFTVSCVLRSFK